MGKPILLVQQIGKWCGTWDSELADCWELRTFVPGCDYYTQEQPMGCVAKRKIDDRLFCAPDYRFCKNAHYVVLWLYERRLSRKETVPKKP